MNNKLESENIGSEKIDEKVLKYIVINVKKGLERDRITRETEKYAELVEYAIRRVLIGKNILQPGQPSGEKQELFDRIKSALGDQDVISQSRKWEITSAQRQQLREEKRAGQTYKESGLE